MSDVCLYFDLTYVNMDQTPSADNQNVDVLRLFDTV